MSRPGRREAAAYDGTSDSEAALGHYYYAGGGRIELQDDDEHVAVDTSLAPAGIMERVDAGTLSRLPGNVVVAPTSAIAGPDLEKLKASGALRPVFRRDRALLVPMPEVRVEFDDEQQRAMVERVLAGSKHALVVSEASSDRMVIAPTSGDPLEALQVANDIYERARPAASSARFVQVVPRPGPAKKKAR